MLGFLLAGCGGSTTEPTGPECAPLYAAGDCASGLVCDTCTEDGLTFAECNDGSRRPFDVGLEVAQELAADCAGEGGDDTAGTGGDTGSTTDTWPPAAYALVEVRCQAFVVDDWADRFGPATLEVDDGVFVVDVAGAGGCAYRESWTGSLYGEMSFTGSACPDGQCDMPGGWACRSSSARATGAWTLDGGVMTIEGVLNATEPSCAVGLVTVWER